MKIIILFTFLLLVSIWEIYDFVKSLPFGLKIWINHKQRMKNRESWKLFNEMVRRWSEEIEDSQIKVTFITYFTELNKKSEIILTKYQQEILEVDIHYKNQIDIESEKVKITQKWGKHIPSLLREVREEKLKELGIL